MISLCVPAVSITQGKRDLDRATTRAMFHRSYRVRKFDVPVDFDGYRSWRRDHAPDHARPSVAAVDVSAQSKDAAVHSVAAPDPNSPAAAPSADPPAPYPSSFSHIVGLITKGEPVPGVREIPDTVLEGEASQSTADKRRKPWESGDVTVASQTQSEGAGT